jgi:hypothetical protein
MIPRRLFKKVLESKPEGRRRIGRPRLKWLKRICERLRWRHKAVDRESGRVQLRRPELSVVGPRNK